MHSVKNVIHVAGANSQAATPRAAAAYATQQMKAESNAAPTTTASGAVAPSAAGSIAGNTEQHSGSVKVGPDQVLPPGTTSNSVAQNPGTGTLEPSDDSAGTSSATQGDPQARPFGNASSGNSGLPQSDTAASSNSALQVQIKNALKNEPLLSTSTIVVSVTDSNIQLSGNASTSKEKQTAERIAQSFSGNRRVVSKINVGHASEPVPGSGFGTDQNPSERKPATDQPTAPR